MKQATGWKRKLTELATGTVLFDECMDRHTSIGVGGPADALVFPESAAEAGRIVAFLRAEGIAVFFMGNGTNLLVRDDGFRGVIVSTKALRSIRVEERGGGRAAIRAEAGASLAEVVALAAREGLAGIEFCAGIPGSVGGGIRMNAGAWGSEMKDVLESVDLLNGEGNVRTFPRASLRFEYRNLDLPEGACVLGGIFDLARGDRGAVEARIREILRTRSGKHPLQYRSAGSVFKNPKGVPAGRIIDEAGLKGLTLGGARVSEMHGNFIVNLGSARAADIIGLIGIVRDRVRERTGIDLEPEVKIIGEE
ncbi:MAG: UDP-N-acetylenolpyruvoylglucosamine reductase [Syntrophaceae bacterium PtaB.Bin038]|nr:MAG: UDP-N-acetylenolpyruvoylglucosamine reductase [Syntrophaceae bacterium PtaB.Bin038]